MSAHFPHPLLPAEELDVPRDEFLAILSHELRNPMHAVRTNAWLIRSRSKDVDVLRPAEAIERQVTRLEKLLEDLLDVVRVTQAPRLDFAPVRLQQVVVAAIETTQASVGTERRDLEVDLAPEPIFIHADEGRLGQALGNVLQNAVKYTPQQGRIRVGVRQVSGEAVVTVSDEGIGISAEDLPRIFDLFNRGEQGRRHASNGLGIGLHIARQLVEGHGGVLEARSDGPGKGSIFEIRIPVTAERPAATDRASVADASADAALDILVVDDNRDAADSLSSVLEAQGHRVRLAYDGEEALARVADAPPQLALVDISMPGTDGYEVARRVTARPGVRPVLVAVTGWGAPADKERAKSAGFDYHLTKPLDYDALGALVATVARKLGSDPN